MWGWGGVRGPGSGNPVSCVGKLLLMWPIAGAGKWTRARRCRAMPTPFAAISLEVPTITRAVPASARPVRVDPALLLAAGAAFSRQEEGGSRGRWHLALGLSRLRCRLPRGWQLVRAGVCHHGDDNSGPERADPTANDVDHDRQHGIGVSDDLGHTGCGGRRGVHDQHQQHQPHDDCHCHHHQRPGFPGHHCGADLLGEAPPACHVYGGFQLPLGATQPASGGRDAREAGQRAGQEGTDFSRGWCGLQSSLESAAKHSASRRAWVSPAV